MGATSTLDRVAASIGLLEGVVPAFETALDIIHGGALFALPALLANGLLHSYLCGSHGPAHERSSDRFC